MSETSSAETEEAPVPEAAAADANAVPKEAAEDSGVERAQFGDLDGKAASATAARAAGKGVTAPGGATAGAADVGLDMILDVPVNLTLEVGRTRMNVRELLQLTQGSVVELDRLAGEAMDVLVNGTLVAHGEVVVVDDRFGVRLTDVVSPAQRIQRLN